MLVKPAAFATNPTIKCSCSHVYMIHASIAQQVPTLNKFTLRVNLEK